MFENICYTLNHLLFFQYFSNVFYFKDKNLFLFSIPYLFFSFLYFLVLVVLVMYFISQFYICIIFQNFYFYIYILFHNFIFIFYFPILFLYFIFYFILLFYFDREMKIRQIIGFSRQEFLFIYKIQIYVQYFWKINKILLRN